MTTLEIWGVILGTIIAFFAFFGLGFFIGLRMFKDEELYQKK